jgi:hypothetical protein
MVSFMNGDQILYGAPINQEEAAGYPQISSITWETQASLAVIIRLLNSMSRPVSN